MLNTSGPLSGLLQYMNYLQKGLAVHTDNIGRTDVPGAQANELKPFSEQVKKRSSASISRTSTGHLSPKPTIAGTYSVSKVKGDDVAANGNGIDRHDELAKINNITTDYLKATRLYQKGVGMLRTILGSKG